MKTLQERIIRMEVKTPSRATEELQPGDEPSIIHFCLEGKSRPDDTLVLYNMDMTAEFIPPADDSTIVVIRLM